jgi:hypothetical protein
MDDNDTEDILSQALEYRHTLRWELNFDSTWEQEREATGSQSDGALVGRAGGQGALAHRRIPLPNPNPSPKHDSDRHCSPPASVSLSAIRGSSESSGESFLYCQFSVVTKPWMIDCPNLA